MTSDQKDILRQKVAELVASFAQDNSLSQEEVGNELYLFSQRRWRNPTEAQKNASFRHWEGVCQRCGEKVSREKAKFHHLQRGIPSVHSPNNLVPEHLKCHDREHGVRRGSLSKGAPKRSPRKAST